MTLQAKVNRQLTTAFPGSITRDGVLRSRPGRVMSPSGKNLITAAFGYSGETGAPVDELVGKSFPANPMYPSAGDITIGLAGEVAKVVVGGDVFFGVLGHTKHYANFGTADGALEPNLSLPYGAEGEFIYCVTGMAAIVYNYTANSVQVGFGTQLGYVLATATAVQNPNGVPVGGLVPVLDPSSVPAGVKLIPNSSITTAFTLPASAAGKPNSATVQIAMTN